MKNKPHIVYLSLGSNIENRINNIIEAIIKIKSFSEITDISPIVETKSWGFNSDNFFLNIVIKIKSKFDEFELLNKLKKIETEMGRTKTGNGYEDRNIDIDILFFDKKIVISDTLIIPHKHLINRLFVLNPFNSISPNFVHPKNKKTINFLLKNCTDKSEIRTFMTKKSVNDIIKK